MSNYVTILAKLTLNFGRFYRELCQIFHEVNIDFYILSQEIVKKAFWKEDRYLKTSMPNYEKLLNRLILSFEIFYEVKSNS